MALIKCPKCGKQFSDRAKACPQCGTPTNEVEWLIQEQKDKEATERERLRKVYSVVLQVLIALGMIFIVCLWYGFRFWSFCVVCALQGVALLIYGVKLNARNKDFAIICGSLWLSISLLLLFGSFIFSGIFDFLWGNVLPYANIISTILFIISCYLPDLKKKTLQNK